MSTVRIGVVGGGIAGPAAALLLARDGHDVTLVERVLDPGPVGAGILLQPLGQRVLDELGLLDALARRSMPVRRFDGRTRGGRRVLDFGYDDHPACVGLYGLGVHRAELSTILWTELAQAGIATRTATLVEDLRSTPDGWQLEGPAGSIGPFDLVVAADGARSRLRRRLRLATKGVGYPYGAIWAIVDDPGGCAGEVLYQRYDGPRVTLGVLPTGVRQASIFWLIRSRSIDAAMAAGPAAFIERARPYAGHLGQLLERVERIMPARYRDVVVPDPTVTVGGHGVVLVGDAAHAMSPQLGLGGSLALADAWSLARSIRETRDLPSALRAHVADRRANVRWYTWLSRFMTPVFQSDLVPIGWPRDLLFEPVSRIPWVRRQFVEIELGRQTSPWSTWPPAADDGPLAIECAGSSGGAGRAAPP